MAIDVFDKASLDTMLSTHKVLIRAERDKFPNKAFIKNTRSTHIRGFLFASACVLCAVGISIPAGITETGGWSWYQVLSNFVRTLPFTIVPAIGYFAATEYTNWRQKHTTSFDLVAELRGERFSKIRFYVSEMAGKADGINDIEHMSGWFPADGYVFHKQFVNKPATQNEKDFEKEHALSDLAIFLFRLYLYAKHDLLEKSLARHMFHHFFSHYQILMLEFSEALRKHKERLVNEGFYYDEKWDILPSGIEKALNLLALESRLPDGHKFLYFPSARNASYNVKNEAEARSRES